MDDEGRQQLACLRARELNKPAVDDDFEGPSTRISTPDFNSFLAFKYGSSDPQVP
jgi:hypothetical protein